MKHEKPNKGVLLIAEPTIFGDATFNRSVVLLADYTEQGAVGFILNKNLNLTLTDLIPDLKQDFPVYNGGPVEQDNLYFIHHIPNLIPDSIEISNGIYWGGNFQAVKKLISNNLIKPRDIKFFLGYSGWAAKQLEEEMKANHWITVHQYNKNDLLAHNQENYWKEMLQELGGDYLIWANAPENPNYN